MNDRTGGPVGTDHELPKFEGFEERLLGELKTMVADRQIQAVNPVSAPKPGRSPFRMPVRRRVSLGLGAVGLVGALAAAVIVPGEGVMNATPTPGYAHYELTSFLSQAAAAARSHPVPLPNAGEVFVERVRSGQTGPRTLNKVRCYLMVYRTLATGRAAFPTKQGPCGGKLRTIIPEQIVYHPVGGGWSEVDTKRDLGAHGYPDPDKLPTRPAALLVALNRAAARGHWNTGTLGLPDGALVGSKESRVGIMFALIERLLQVPIRPTLRAALFEVTGRLHGIYLDRHATDLIGRPGVGISLSLGVKGQPGIGLQFVVDAKTYQFLGVAWNTGIYGKPAQPEKSGYAVIESYMQGKAERSPRR
jgi:hypothetical protein